MAGAVRPAVFLDRDGTIIVDKHYLSDPDQVELEEGASDGLRRLAKAGLRLVGITNQSGVAKGLFAVSDVERANDRVDTLLAEYNVFIERWYVCPHDGEGGCDCRKPAPGLMHRAATELGIDLSTAFVIGDKISDVELVGATPDRGILVSTGKGASAAQAAAARGFPVVRNLNEAADYIAAHLDGRAAGDA